MRNKSLLMLSSMKSLMYPRCESRVPVVHQDAFTHVEGVQYRDARGLISPDTHRHAEREQTDNGMVQPIQMKQIEDFRKPQDYHIHRDTGDEAHVKSHVGHENRV